MAQVLQRPQLQVTTHQLLVHQDVTYHQQQLLEATHLPLHLLQPQHQQIPQVMEEPTGEKVNLVLC